MSEWDKGKDWVCFRTEKERWLVTHKDDDAICSEEEALWETHSDISDGSEQCEGDEDPMVETPLKKLA